MQGNKGHPQGGTVQKKGDAEPAETQKAEMGSDVELHVTHVGLVMEAE